MVTAISDPVAAPLPLARDLEPEVDLVLGVLVERAERGRVLGDRAQAEPNAAKFLEGLSVRKIIIVPGKIVNIVAG